MFKKIVSLLAAATMLTSLVAALPASAAGISEEVELNTGFGDSADFDSEEITSRYSAEIAAGTAIKSENSWLGKCLDEHTNANYRFDYQKQIKITDGIIVQGEGVGAEGDNAALQLPTGKTSTVDLYSRVEEGKNYVITFYTKTKAANALHFSIDYYIQQQNAGTKEGYPYSVFRVYMDSATYHNADCTKGITAKNNVKFNAEPDAGHIDQSGISCTNRNTEWHFCDTVGYTNETDEASTPWVKNQYEIRVPHCANVVRIQVLANGRTSDAYRFVDNFTIEELPETDNLIVNGEFDYSAHTLKTGWDGGNAKETFTNWFVVRSGSSSNAQWSRVNDNGNYYYTVDNNIGNSSEYLNGGYGLGQYITLDPGVYKLSYKRNNMDGDHKDADGNDVAWGYVSMRVPTDAAKTYSNEPSKDAQSLGSVPADEVPVKGCSLFPGIVGNQKTGDGWQKHEVYFEITEYKTYYLVFGNRYNEWGKFAIDDVELVPVTDDMELRLAKSAIASTGTKNFTWTGQAEATTWYANATVEDAASIAGVGTVKPILTVKKNANGVQGDIITAVYNVLTDGNMTLNNIETESFTVPANTFGLVAPRYALTVPNDGNYVAKSFVWTALEDLDALMKSATLE